MAAPKLKERETDQEIVTPARRRDLRVVTNPSYQSPDSSWLNDNGRHSVLSQEFSHKKTTFGYKLASLGLYVISFGLLAAGTAAIVYGVTLGDSPSTETMREVIQTQGTLTDLAATYVAGIQIRRQATHT